MNAKKMNRRFAALLMSLLLLTGVITGCGGEEEIQQITLRTASIMGDDGQKEAYTDLMELYSAEYPYVYLMGTVIESENAYMLGAVFEDTYTASRYPHAVFYYTDTGIAQIHDQFVTVDEIRELYPDFASGISEEALNSVRAGDGKVYCVPFAGSWTALAVNNELFELNSLEVPAGWQELTVTAGILSARGITPFANSPDDSAALLELICLSVGNESVLDSMLNKDKPLYGRTAQEAWLTVLERYDELCGINAFPDPVLTDELSAAFEKKNPVVSGADVPGTGKGALNLQTVETDAVELFNSGGAAMLVVDSGDLPRITLEDYSLVTFPDCTEDGSGKRVLVGGYNTGWYITRRAFEDQNVRDEVVAFVDIMTGAQAADSFSALGFLPSYTSGSDVDGSQLDRLAADAEDYVESRRTSVNGERFSRLERIAAAISLGLITPQQGLEVLCDPELELLDAVVAPELPQSAVSASDVPASQTDAAQ